MFKNGSKLDDPLKGTDSKKKKYYKYFFAYSEGSIYRLSKINITGYSLNIEKCPKSTKTKVSEYLL